MRRFIAWFAAGLLVAGTLSGCGLMGWGDNEQGINATPSGRGVQLPND